MCADCRTNWPLSVSLSLSLPSGLSVPWDTILKFRPITLQWFLSIQVKGRVFHFNQKLEMITLKRGRHVKRKKKRPKASSWDCKEKVLEGTYKGYFSKHMNDERVKQPYCWYGESFSGLDRRSNQPRHSFKAKPNPDQGPNLLQFREDREGKKLQKKSLKLAELVHEV